MRRGDRSLVAYTRQVLSMEQARRYGAEWGDDTESSFLASRVGSSSRPLGDFVLVHLSNSLEHTHFRDPLTPVHTSTYLLSLNLSSFLFNFFIHASFFMERSYNFPSSLT